MADPLVSNLGRAAAGAAADFGAGIDGIRGPGFRGSAAGAATTDGAAAFADLFADAVKRVENYRAQADQAVERFLRGEEEEIHKAAMAVQQADLSFDLFLQTKNKVMQAYQEIMRMQL